MSKGNVPVSNYNPDYFNIRTMNKPNKAFGFKRGKEIEMTAKEIAANIWFNGAINWDSEKGEPDEAFIIAIEDYASERVEQAIKEERQRVRDTLVKSMDWMATDLKDEVAYKKGVKEERERISNNIGLYYESLCYDGDQIADIDILKVLDFINQPEGDKKE